MLRGVKSADAPPRGGGGGVLELDACGGSSMAATGVGVDGLGVGVRGSWLGLGLGLFKMQGSSTTRRFHGMASPCCGCTHGVRVTDNSSTLYDLLNL
jgi:hypothetical protein